MRVTLNLFYCGLYKIISFTPLISHNESLDCVLIFYYSLFLVYARFQCIYKPEIFQINWQWNVRNNLIKMKFVTKLLVNHSIRKWNWHISILIRYRLW